MILVVGVVSQQVYYAAGYRPDISFIDYMKHDHLPGPGFFQFLNVLQSLL